jgi:hypothetical protein
MVRENNEFLIIYEFVDEVINYWVIFLPNIRIIKKMSHKFKMSNKCVFCQLIITHLHFSFFRSSKDQK